MYTGWNWGLFLLNSEQIFISTEAIEIVLTYFSSQMTWYTQRNHILKSYAIAWGFENFPQTMLQNRRLCMIKLVKVKSNFLNIFEPGLLL